MLRDRANSFALVVEDHPLVADSLVSCIQAFDPQIETLTTASVRAAEQMLAERPAPVLIITDLMLTDAKDTEAVRRLRAAAPHSPLLVFTALEDPKLRSEANACGANAYLVKSSTTQALMEKVRDILDGHPRGASSAPPRLSQLQELLTERQLVVLEELAAGRSNKEIANRLKISDLTVNAHVKHIFGRLAVKNRTEAAVRYFLMTGQSPRQHSHPSTH